MTVKKTEVRRTEDRRTEVRDGEVLCKQSDCVDDQLTNYHERELTNHRAADSI